MFTWLLLFGLTKNSVIFLCTIFCLNHVPTVLEKKGKKEKENVYICITVRTLSHDSISIASAKGIIFVKPRIGTTVFLQSALTEEKKLFQPWIYFFPCLIACNALRGVVVSIFLEENMNV